MKLTAERFATFFEDVHGPGKRPFPWQEELARLAIFGEWPPAIALPTASGKTALIDIAVFALACGAPGAARRTFFVVDRRIIVDEANERAEKIARRLIESQCSDTVTGDVARALIALGGGDNDQPLIVSTLRGGLPRDETWTRSALQPIVCCSTVDQIGSSLLFRAYGSRSNYNWPVRAALVGCDSLLIIDEAHTANPFLQTLEGVGTFRNWVEDREAPKSQFQVVEMSATPRSVSNVFRERKADWDNPVLAMRWKAAKPARLVVTDRKGQGEKGAADGNFTLLISAMTDEARKMRQEGAKVIGVIVNRVASARALYNALSLDQDCNSVLMTGRSRAFDRDRLWEQVRPQIGLDREKEPDKAIYVVATQCIEVGANIDFDGLVTEIASIDSLEQRFGRLNRNGRPIQTFAVIVAQADQTDKRYVDAVYQEALTATWHWLKKRAKKMKRRKETMIDLGISAMREMPSSESERALLTMPRADAPVLLPAHVNRLAETSPVPATEPEVALFLHGPKSGPADVSVIWRADLDETNQKDWADITSRVPPRPEEAITVQVWALRRWLADDLNFLSEMADVEGQNETESPTSGFRRVLRWRGPDDSEVIESNGVRPADTVVIPASYGGCDQWGWNPESASAVEDIGDEVAFLRQKPALRFDPALVTGWTEDGDIVAIEEIAVELRAAEFTQDIREGLKNLSRRNDLKPWVCDAAGQLAKARRLRHFREPEGVEGIRMLTAVATQDMDIEQDTLTSSYTRQVPLDQHLEGCRRRAERYVQQLALPAKVGATIQLAAALHDLGKADPRFQTLLRGGAPVSNRDKPLAKSDINGRDRDAFRKARVLAGYPRGGRHELQSLAMLQYGDFSGAAEIDEELLLHLVGSHHGRCRPFAPIVSDAAPVEVSYEGFAARSDHKLASAGSGVSERFWKLNRRYGWWGLAYLETIVRLTDHRQSEAEEQDEVSLA